MALNIKDDAADQLARELAAETGESTTTAVTVAVRERLERLRGAVPRERRGQELSRIATRSATRPVTDLRRAEELLGYGPDGPTSLIGHRHVSAARGAVDEPSATRSSRCSPVPRMP